MRRTSQIFFSGQFHCCETFLPGFKSDHNLCSLWQSSKWLRDWLKVSRKNCYFSGQWRISATGVVLLEDIKQILLNFWRYLSKHYCEILKIFVTNDTMFLIFLRRFDIYLASLTSVSWYFEDTKDILKYFQDIKNIWNNIDWCVRRYNGANMAQNGAKYCPKLATYCAIQRRIWTSLTGVIFLS